MRFSTIWFILILLFILFIFIYKSYSRENASTRNIYEYDAPKDSETRSYP